MVSCCVGGAPDASAATGPGRGPLERRPAQHRMCPRPPVQAAANLRSQARVECLPAPAAVPGRRSARRPKGSSPQQRPSPTGLSDGGKPMAPPRRRAPGPTRRSSFRCTFLDFLRVGTNNFSCSYFSTRQDPWPGSSRVLLSKKGTYPGAAGGVERTHLLRLKLSAPSRSEPRSRATARRAGR
jgi:hypothetical protein